MYLNFKKVNGGIVGKEAQAKNKTASDFSFYY